MLKQAGFNDTQIVDWIDNQRQYLKTAGFSDFDINEAYGLKQQNSKAITSKDMSSAVSDVFPQHKELGKNTALENKTNKQNENIINTNLINDNHNKNIDGTNYNNLIEAEQEQISLMYENAKTLFKDNDEGKVGYVNEWFDKNLPNVDKESTKFLALSLSKSLKKMSYLWELDFIPKNVNVSNQILLKWPLLSLLVK